MQPMDLHLAALRVAGLTQPLQDRPDYGAGRDDGSEDREEPGDSGGDGPEPDR